MNKKIKRFIREHKTEIVTATIVAIPLIVINIKFFKANRQWSARNGCHDNSSHLHFTDETFEKVINGGKMIFSFDDKKVDSAGVVIMTGETYDKELGLLNEFKQK